MNNENIDEMNSTYNKNYGVEHTSDDTEKESVKIPSDAQPVETVGEDKMKTLMDFINVESAKSELADETEKIREQHKRVTDLIGDDDNTNFLMNKLEQMSLSECENHLKSDENVLNFFIDKDTGDEIVIDIDFESKKREIDFKRGLLVYLKSSQETMDKIDEEYRKLDDATKEMNMSMKEVCKELSDNTLAYIRYMKDKAAEITDVAQKRSMLEAVKYIESGYTMEVFKDVIIQHPSVGEKCPKEIRRWADIERITKRYTNNLKRQHIKTSLVQFISDSEHAKASFEEDILIRGEQYIIPDLFVFSLIRYFAMADWRDKNVRKVHASIILVLKRLLANDFTEDVKEDIIDNIVEYLKMFRM